MYKTLVQKKHFLLSQFSVLKYISLALLLCTVGCSKGLPHGSNDLYFTSLSAGKTNIHFNNQLTESDSVNFVTDQYVYIGAGVGVGDFNNDGLQDIFFAGGQVSSRLYINKGNFEFEDVTEKAGITTNVWCTGVSVIDINNDGLMDIYVCVSHARESAKRKNLLFINKGNLQFAEEAAEYGLADDGFSTQAAFFDYDHDGDLDMYLMNHNVFQNQPNNIVSQNAAGSSSAADKLYRNEGSVAGAKHPVYKDVSAEAGIKDDGYGLGLTISDLNNDGWPDVYVANDFIGNDLLWLNNGNGTFTNCIKRSMRHQSYNSMGVDAADINNDGLPDVGVLDMLPETNERKKTMFAGSNPERYDMEQSMGGYQPEFTRNMLQLQTGTRRKDNMQEPFFSEIGQLAGVSETDWSWSLLMADFDNDGWKDIQVTNGIARDLTNNDFLFYRNTQNAGGFSGNNTDVAGNSNSIQSLRKDLDAYGSITISNYFFHNNGNLIFKDETAATGLQEPSVSHGAAYVDLDNDGDLDLVINNMNQDAFICRNELRKSIADSAHNFLTLQLKGAPTNLTGIGSKVTLYAKGGAQFIEQNPVRGYMSSVDDRLHFGIGNTRVIDSIKVIWPDQKEQVLKQVHANQFVSVSYGDAHEQRLPNDDVSQPLFSDATNDVKVSFRHNETFFFDYGNQRMLPQRYSQLGPPIATGDVNGDGLIDFFVGGASRQTGEVFIQKQDGSFRAENLVAGEKSGEDIGAVLFDADGDGDLDLLVCEGSLEFGNDPIMNRPRLYQNDGHGKFTLDDNAIPANITGICQVVATGDYDGDGDPDVFLGGRVLPNQYPLSPRSYILQNNHGKFTDVTPQVCPALEAAGMITSATWTDLDNDKKPDLVIAGEWMPVRFFKNNNGKLNELTTNTGLVRMKGLWRSLTPADIDKDGDMDLVAGNIGLNNKYHTSSERPLKMYAKDIDHNGSLDLIPAYYIKDKKGDYELFPGLDRTQFAEELPAIKKQYLLNKDFSSVNMATLLKQFDNKDLLELTCETNSTVWLENLGNFHFRVHQLPVEAQFAPVNAVVAKDLDGDGKKDLLLAGNEYQVEISSGRYDASYGLFLKGDGKGNFTPVSAAKSGFVIDGDVKNMQFMDDGNSGALIVAAVNNDSIKCFHVNRTFENIKH